MSNSSSDEFKEWKSYESSDSSSLVFGSSWGKYLLDISFAFSLQIRHLLMYTVNNTNGKAIKKDIDQGMS